VRVSTAGWRALLAWSTVALVVVGAASCRAPGGEARPPEAPPAPGLPQGVDLVVERVVDGDTVVVSGNRSVRLIGVDAPETKDPRRPVGCFGREASRFLISLLPRGTTVRLVGDVESEDRYGRLLAYVYRRADGLFVNAELVRQGYAHVLTIPPNLAHADELVALAGQARLADRGLWGACAA
jgi:micrococcal nuclease